MTSTRHPRRSSSPAAAGAFTLVELVTVLVLVSVLAAVAVPTLSSLGTTRGRFAARMVFKDLTFIRDRAIATGTRQFAVFSPSSETYTLLGEDPSNAGRANAQILTEPATNLSYIRTLGADETPGIEIVSADFDGSNEVGFDWKGRPLNSLQASLTAQGTVSLTGGNTVNVLTGSGLVTLTTP